MAHATHLKTLPADLSAPAFVSAWRTRALIIGAVFGVIGIILAFLGNAWVTIRLPASAPLLAAGLHDHASASRSAAWRC